MRIDGCTKKRKNCIHSTHAPMHSHVCYFYCKLLFHRNIVYLCGKLYFEHWTHFGPSALCLWFYICLCFPVESYDPHVIGVCIFFYCIPFSRNRNIKFNSKWVQGINFISNALKCNHGHASLSISLSIFRCVSELERGRAKNSKWAAKVCMF